MLNGDWSAVERRELLALALFHAPSGIRAELEQLLLAAEKLGARIEVDMLDAGLYGASKFAIRIKVGNEVLRIETGEKGR